MRAAAVLLFACLAGLVAAEADPYAAWWIRADAALVAGDAAASARLAADPPPAAAGGPARLHHRLLVAWLAGDAAARARLGGLLGAVRSSQAPALRLLGGEVPATAVPAAGAVAFQPEGIAGPAEWTGFVAKAAAGGDLGDILLIWEHVTRAWLIDAEVARATTGFAQAPPPVPEDEREALRFLVRCLPGAWSAEDAWGSPAGLAFRYRVRRDCPAAWAPVASEISEAGPAAARDGSRLLDLVAAARANAASGRIILPVLRVWAERRLRVPGFGWTWQAGAGAALLEHCCADPAAAGREAEVFGRHLAAYAAGQPAMPAADPEVRAGPAMQMGGRPASAAVRDAIARWSAAAAAWAAANHAIGRPLPAWTAVEVVEAQRRLAVLIEATAPALEDLQWAPADGSSYLGALIASLHEAATAALAAQAQALAAPGFATGRARDEALAAVAANQAALIAVLPAEATLLEATGHQGPLPIPSLHLGLGEPAAVPPPGWVDPDAAADPVLLAACPQAPARTVAERLVALRHAGVPPTGLAAAWERWLRRSAGYRALAEARNPELDLLDEAARAATPMAAALISAARRGGEPAPAAAVSAWLAAVSTPRSGGIVAVAVQGGRPAWLDDEIFAFRANDLDASWGVLAQWLREDPQPAARLAEIEILGRLVPGDPAARKAAAGLAAWAWERQHSVVSAFAALAADGWKGRDAFLVAARTWLASRPETKP